MENYITKQELEKMIENKQDFQLIDVRSETEYEELHIPFAENIPIEEIDQKQIKLDKETLVITTCGKGGGRSENASLKLKELGFKSLFLEGGTFEWFEK